MLKKVTMAIALTGLMAGLAYAGQLPKSGINGSAHDMNLISGAEDTMGRTCVYCHTPHNAKAAGASPAPLWNRGTTANNTAYTWVAPLNQGFTISDPLTGPSRLCMSCHDGVLAVDSHQGGNHNMTSTTRTMPNLGTTHPIGFDYTAAEARTAEILPAATTKFLLTASYGSSGGTFNTNGGLSRTGAVQGEKTIASTLFTVAASGSTPAKAIMTCASCHEVHNTTNATNTKLATANYFLNAPEDGSAICLSCHIK
jgi:hypothetical protein